AFNSLPPPDPSPSFPLSSPSSCFFFFFSRNPPPPTSTLFPYTTLFRSPTARSPALPDRSGRARPPWRLPAGPAPAPGRGRAGRRSEEHTSELQSRGHLVCRLLLEKKKP